LYSSLRLAAKYGRYYITASNGKGHGVHSPFVYDFIVHVLNDRRSFYAYSKIEDLRNRLLLDERILEVQDFGAGSVTGQTKNRSVAAITRSAAKSKKLAQLLFRIVNYYQPQTIVELGTSLGISAAYMAMGNIAAKLVSLEGAAAVAEVAKENFSSLHITGIETVIGNFDNTLSLALDKLDGIDMAFVDGNHRAAPTLRYFEWLLQKARRPAILVFDDIHWSADMEAAWDSIKKHPDVFLTVDLFFLGLVFLNDDFKVKQNFVIRF